MKLHLGCGTRRLPGYTHIDARAEVEPDIVGDVANLHMIDDNSVSLVYACHVLEHLKPKTDQALSEWRRVLKPGCKLRLSVPNFGAIVDLYRSGVILMRLWGLLYGGQTYPENTHYVCYDYQSLAYLLATSGFHSIAPWNPTARGAAALDKFPAGYDDYSMAKIDGRLISLNVEARAK